MPLELECHLSTCQKSLILPEKIESDLKSKARPHFFHEQSTWVKYPLLPPRESGVLARFPVMFIPVVDPPPLFNSDPDCFPANITPVEPRLGPGAGAISTSEGFQI